jgi:hypothetical protein
LLDRNVKTRLGANNHNDIKNHPFFKNLDWNDVYNKRLTPPSFSVENDEENFAQE